MAAAIIGGMRYATRGVEHGPRRCPACNQPALVEISPARYICGHCSADYTRVGIQWLRNEDHVPVARLK